MFIVFVVLLGHVAKTVCCSHEPMPGYIFKSRLFLQGFDDFRCGGQISKDFHLHFVELLAS